MFISQEIDDLLSVYSINPFGDKKDKRINLWLDLLDQSALIAVICNRFGQRSRSGRR